MIRTSQYCGSINDNDKDAEKYGHSNAFCNLEKKKKKKHPESIIFSRKYEITNCWYWRLLPILLTEKHMYRNMLISVYVAPLSWEWPVTMETFDLHSLLFWKDVTF